MKISRWIIAAAFAAPLFACSSSNEDGVGGSGGSGASVVTAGAGGTDRTGGPGGGVISGGTGGGTGGGATGGTGGGVTGGTGGSTNGTGGTGGPECALQTNIPECDSCLASACAAECQTAMAEPSVGDLLTCYSPCSDQACMDACDAQFPEGAAAFSAFNDCAGAKCAAECGEPTGACTLAIPDNPTCNACFQPKCENECVAAVNDPTLGDYLDCVKPCTDEECVNLCDTQFPAAATALGGLSDCMEAKCASECASCGLSTGLTACDDCFQDKCKTECLAAQDEQTLNNYLRCIQPCTDQACLDDCAAQFPAAAATFGPFNECIATQCATECAGP